MKVTGLLLGAFLVVLPTAQASITFAATYDPSLTSADQLAIGSALTEIATYITSPNNITVSLYFTAMTSGLGESFTSYAGVTYQQYYSNFSAVATQPNQITALNSLGPAPTASTPDNPVNGTTQIDLTTAEARNLGFADAGGILPNSNIADATGGGTFDSEIGLNTTITDPPGPNNGSNYGLESVANHEIDEALGIGGSGSTIGGTGFFANPGDLDLYRYTCGATIVGNTCSDPIRSYSTTQTTNPFSYFSINGGTTILSYFTQTTGADYGDWLSNCTSATLCQANGLPNGFSPQVQDAFSTPGTNPQLGTNELLAFNAIGYQMTAPEPSTFVLAGLGLALGFGFIRRKK